MGKVEQVIRCEIGRLARKEIRAAFAPLKRDTRRLKRVVRDLARKLAPLERLGKLQEKALQEQGVQWAVSEEAVRKSRMSARLIRKLRQRLGLTQTQLAALVGVSGPAVALWESGRSAPRGENRAALVALRGRGKREVRLLLAHKMPPAAKRASKHAPRRVRRPRR